MTKLSISNIAWDSAQNGAVYALMKRYGFSGVEIAPTRIFPEQPYSHLDEATAWAERLFQAHGFVIPSMQSILYGRAEKLFGAEEERAFLLDYTKRAVDFASAIGCKNLVFGCPKNRAIPEGLSEDERRANIETVAVPFFREIGDYAAAHGTVIGLEANPAIYGTNFVNATQEATELIRAVNSSGFKLNLDVGTMIQNGESVELLRGNASLINHVHISEPFLKKIEKRGLHKELLSFLQSENYTGFVSVEMAEQKSLQDIEEILRYMEELVNEK